MNPSQVLSAGLVQLSIKYNQNGPFSATKYTPKKTVFINTGMFSLFVATHDACRYSNTDVDTSSSKVIKVSSCISHSKTMRDKPAGKCSAAAGEKPTTEIQGILNDFTRTE